MAQASKGKKQSKQALATKSFYTSLAVSYLYLITWYGLALTLIGMRGDTFINSFLSILYL